jgi:DNA-binding MarR family transcriptional regulator
MSSSSSSSESLRSRLGLDYIFEPASSAPSSSRAEVDTSKSSYTAALEGLASERFLEAVGRLSADSDDETGTVRLHKVAEAVQLDAGILVPLSQRLSSAGLIEIVSSDSAFGDYDVKLTPDATKLLKAPDRVEILKRLS